MFVFLFRNIYMLPRLQSFGLVLYHWFVCAFVIELHRNRNSPPSPSVPQKILLTTVSNRCQSTFNECVSVMWSETVGLKDQSDQKIGLGLVHCGLDLGLGLADLVLFCETWSCRACRHNESEGHSYFSSTIYSFSILWLEHHYCGDPQWRSQFSLI